METRDTILNRALFEKELSISVNQITCHIQCVSITSISLLFILIYLFIIWFTGINLS